MLASSHIVLKGMDNHSYFVNNFQFGWIVQISGSISETGETRYL